jgi:MarR family transcriptional regulator, organic hydroperoxide resistance regulator
MASKRAQEPQHLFHLIKDALRRGSRSLHMRLAEHSVSVGHWTFLRILWVNDGLTQSELSERAGLMQPTTFFAVSGMEQLGYIRREKLPNSRRNVHIFLTPAGRALRKRLVPYAAEIEALAGAGISARDIAATRRTLLAMIENLAKDELEGLRKKRRVRSTREISRFMRTSRSPKRRRNAALQIGVKRSGPAWAGPRAQRVRTRSRNDCILP